MGILPPGRYAIAVSTTGQYLQMIGNEGQVTPSVWFKLFITDSFFHLDVYNTVSTGEGSGDKDEQVGLYPPSLFSFSYSPPFQQWRVLEAKEGWFYVQNAATEYYLSVDGSKVIGTPKPVTEWFAAETSLNSALY